MADVFTISHVGLWLLVITEGVLVVGLLGRLIELRGLLETVDLPGTTLAIGSRAAQFSAADARSSQLLSLDTFRRRRGVLLFLSSACASCKRLAAHLDLPPAYRTRFIAVCEDNSLVNVLQTQVQCLVDVDGQLARSYRVERFPLAIIIDDRSAIAGVRQPHNSEDIAQWLDAQQLDTTTSVLPVKNSQRVAAGDHQLSNASPTE